MSKINKISVIIPFKGKKNQIIELLDVLNKQTKLPDEILIIDTNSQSQRYIMNDYKNLKINYNHKPNLFPGAARNLGVKNSNYEIICFLDLKTFPENNRWLENLYQYYVNNKKNIIFGSTNYSKNKNTYQTKLIIASSFGNVNHQTIPGSMMSKKIFYKIGLFYENVRAGEDYEWKNRAKNIFLNIDTNYNDPLNYYPINSNILGLARKYFIYNIHSSRLNILTNQKMFFMSILLILSALIIPRWNYYINGWDNNIFYVPNITKIFIIILFSFSVIYFSFIINNKKNNNQNIFNQVLIVILLFFLTYSIYNYNYFIIEKFDAAVFYIPHITKIYIFILLLISFIFRGIYLPLKRNIDKEFIKKNFILIGITGLIFDFAKIPGNIIGYFMIPINIFFLKKKHNTNKTKKTILFVCPYPVGVQAGQRLKYEQFFPYFKKNGYDITVNSFIDKKSWEFLYKKGFVFKKTISLIKGYFKRIFLIINLPKYDVVYIFMWVTPYGFSFFERIYRFLSTKIIYDIEDNILIIKKNDINPINSIFKTQSKIRYLIKSSNNIIASSEQLAKECNNISKNNNSHYICASINVHRYNPNNLYNNSKIINIGWTGTFTSKIYLDLLKPLFINLSKRIKFKLIVISDFDYNIPGVDLEVIKWTKESEIKDLQKIDIGVYPLSIDQWVSGKSGLKALQYMAMALPTVATEVGNIKNVITHNHDGFLVKNISEWEETITTLINNPDLRKKIGSNARKTVIEKFSLEVNSIKYLNILKKL